ncbi:MAG: S41 family peptidase, partial [Acidobacteriota bacterium]|nr:S41 family peptidase [Acidobacteriota bacterium]
MRRPWRIVAIALFMLALLLGGFMGDRVLALTDEARDWLRLYTELVDVVHDRYGGEVTYADLVQSSISGMLRTLDPHTSFLAPRAYDTMRERQQSSFYGLGILVGMRHGQLTVINPLEGTPASRLGIRAGDVIAGIEGETTETMSLDEAVRLLKGPKGTQVNITIVRRGLDIPLELAITRDEIPQNTVRYTFMITPETGYLTISDFNRATGNEVRDALADLESQGMTSLIIDLRGNGGGLLDQAIEVAQQFLPEGAKIVETRGRTGDSFQEFRAGNGDEELGVPVVVLVGEGTASAAEILAGAIQDHDVGLIVGTPTWGKGLV